MRQFQKTLSLLVLVGLIGIGVFLFIGESLGSIKKQEINDNHDKTQNSDGAFVKESIAEFMSGESSTIPQDDVQIIDYIWRQGLIQPPSRNEYNLNLTKPEHDPSSGQSQYILKLMKNMTNGFFVECGALDGETYSNTLFMEKNLNWRGLLVEAEPSNFALLAKKNRKAWISNTCLSIKPYPHTAIFQKSRRWTSGYIVIGKSKMSDQDVRVQCMPIFSLLAAINVTTVDYFSLDVEGSELQVLKTIPFDKVFIRTLSVKIIRLVEGKDAVRTFMESQGYKLHGIVNVRGGGKFADDFLFAHKDANIDD